MGNDLRTMASFRLVQVALQIGSWVGTEPRTVESGTGRADLRSRRGHQARFRPSLTLSRGRRRCLIRSREFSTVAVDIGGRKSYSLSMKSTVSEKGQVTIPKRLRERLGIRPGQVLDFDEDRGRLVATKVSTRDAVDELYGVLEGKQRTDTLMRRLRGEPDAR